MTSNISYTREDKYAAAACYYLYGDFKKAAETCGLAEKYGRKVASVRRNITNWFNEHDDMFMQGLDKASKELDKKLLSKIAKVEEMALDRAIGSLSDPESKIPAKDATWIAGLMHDKRQIMEGKAVSITTSSSDVKSRLDELEKELHKRAEKAKKPSLSVVADMDRFKKVEPDNST